MTNLEELFSERQMARLTKNQRVVLEYIIGKLEASGYFPSTTEISNFIQKKTRMSAYGYLTALHQKGFLDHIGDASRGHFVVRAKITLLPEVPKECLLST